MSDEWICPVMTPQFRKVGELAVLDQPKTCIREECAWWVSDDNFDQCAIPVLATYAEWTWIARND